MDHNGRSLSFAACEEGAARCLATLLACGADVDRTDECGDTPLVAAIRNGHRASMAVLLQRSATGRLPVDLNRVLVGFNNCGDVSTSPYSNTGRTALDVCTRRWRQAQANVAAANERGGNANAAAPGLSVTVNGIPVRMGAGPSRFQRAADLTACRALLLGSGALSAVAARQRRQRLLSLLLFLGARLLGLGAGKTRRLAELSALWRSPSAQRAYDGWMRPAEWDT